MPYWYSSSIWRISGRRVPSQSSGVFSSNSGSATISNDGAISHSYLIVDLAKGTEVAPGEEGTLTIADDATAGTYRVICDLPGHVEEGMVGTLEIP